jgi:hypothetical protein
MAIIPKVKPQGQLLPPKMSQVEMPKRPMQPGVMQTPGIPQRPMPQVGAPMPQNMRGGVGMVPPGAMPQRSMPPGVMPPGAMQAAGMPQRPMPPSVMPAPAAMPPVPAGALKKGGQVKKYAAGGLTPAERKAMMDEKVTPPKGETKKNADIFRQGMKPPMDDDMGSAQPGQPGQPAKKKAKGGSIKASKMGSVKTSKPTMRSASSRADGIAIRGKTRA